MAKPASPARATRRGTGRSAFGSSPGNRFVSAARTRLGLCSDAVRSAIGFLRIAFTARRTPEFSSPVRNPQGISLPGGKTASGPACATHS